MPPPPDWVVYKMACPPFQFLSAHHPVEYYAPLQDFLKSERSMAWFTVCCFYTPFIVLGLLHDSRGYELVFEDGGLWIGLPLLLSYLTFWWVQRIEDPGFLRKDTADAWVRVASGGTVAGTVEPIGAGKELDTVVDGFSDTGGTAKEDSEEVATLLASSPTNNNEDSLQNSASKAHSPMRKKDLPPTFQQLPERLQRYSHLFVSPQDLTPYERFAPTISHPDGYKVRLRHCSDCNIFQPLRTKHCKECNRCVALHDHHCPWVGGCVGERNRGRFLLYVFCQCTLVTRLFWLFSTVLCERIRAWERDEVTAGRLESLLGGKMSEKQLPSEASVIQLLMQSVSFTTHKVVRLEWFSWALVLDLIFSCMLVALMMAHTNFAVMNSTTWEGMSWEKISYLGGENGDARVEALEKEARKLNGGSRGVVASTIVCEEGASALTCENEGDAEIPPSECEDKKPCCNAPNQKSARILPPLAANLNLPERNYNNYQGSPFSKGMWLNLLCYFWPTAGWVRTLLARKGVIDLDGSREAMELSRLSQGGEGALFWTLGRPHLPGIAKCISCSADCGVRDMQACARGQVF